MTRRDHYYKSDYIGRKHILVLENDLSCNDYGKAKNNEKISKEYYS